MRKFVLCWGGAILFLSLTAMSVLAAPDADPAPQQEAPGIFVPERGRSQFGFGYQYQHFNVLGRAFHTNGYNLNLSHHLFDWLTGADGRLSVALEGTGAFGFGGHTSGRPRLAAKSLFLGAGPHVAAENRSRIEPWAHVLVGWQRLRFTQTSTLGVNSTFAFMGGGGLDFKLNPQIYWRIQADYIGTHHRKWIESNYSVGSGLVFSF